MNDMMHVQLVPTEVNARFGHLGGVGEYHKYINFYNQLDRSTKDYSYEFFKKVKKLSFWEKL